MHVVVCRDDKVIASFEQPMHISEMAMDCKILFVKWQTQDIYLASEMDNPSWAKCRFTFKITKSGMHPTNVNWDAVLVENLPEDMQMKLLVGAL